MTTIEYCSRACCATQLIAVATSARGRDYPPYLAIKRDWTVYQANHQAALLHKVANKNALLARYQLHLLFDTDYEE